MILKILYNLNTNVLNFKINYKSRAKSSNYLRRNVLRKILSFRLFANLKRTNRMLEKGVQRNVLTFRKWDYFDLVC